MPAVHVLTHTQRGNMHTQTVARGSHFCWLFPRQVRGTTEAPRGQSPHMSYSLTQKDLVHARLSPAVATASTQGGHASSAIVPGRLEMHLISSSSSSPDTSYSLTQHTLTEASLILSPAVATGSTHSGHASIAMGRLEMHLISSSSNSPTCPIHSRRTT